jgi:hypothetical protein
MARGASSKEIITKKILEVFDGAFINDKEIRIPMEEGGETVQIKVALTCAKVNVERGGASSVASSEPAAPAQKVEVTEEEKQNVQKLMAGLGL